MSKHTPGPWQIYDCEFAVRVGIEGGNKTSVITFGAKGDYSGVWGKTTEQAEANARLIASAPELLEALKGAIAELYLIHSKYGDREHAKDCCCAIRHGEEIIAKAEGK